MLEGTARLSLCLLGDSWDSDMSDPYLRLAGSLTFEKEREDGWIIKPLLLPRLHLPSGFYQEYPWGSVLIQEESQAWMASVCLPPLMRVFGLICLYQIIFVNSMSTTPLSPLSALQGSLELQFPVSHFCQLKVLTGHLEGRKVSVSAGSWGQTLWKYDRHMICSGFRPPPGNPLLWCCRQLGLLSAVLLGSTHSWFHESATVSILFLQLFKSLCKLLTIFSLEYRRVSPLAREP